MLYPPTPSFCSPSIPAIWLFVVTTVSCSPQVVFKASSLLSLTFPWVLRKMEIDALDLCKVLESFARFCPGLPVSNDVCGGIIHHPSALLSFPRPLITICSPRAFLLVWEGMFSSFVY